MIPADPERPGRPPRPEPPTPTRHPSPTSQPVATRPSADGARVGRAARSCRSPSRSSPSSPAARCSCRATRRPRSRPPSRARRPPRTRPSSRSGTPTTRSTTATPAARSTARPSSTARSGAWSRRSATRTPRTSRPRSTAEPAGHHRPVRGDRRRDRAREAADGTQRLRDARARLPARRRRADRGLAGREGRACCRRLVLAVDGVGARWPDRRRGPRQGPRPEGHRRSILTIERGDDRAVRPGDHPRRHPAAGGRRARTSPTARRLHPAHRLLRQRGATQFHDALQADLEAGRTKIILDLRGNPGGYVTAARSIASEFIGTAPIFWEQDADGDQIETDADGRRRRDRPGHPARRPRRPRQRVGERDRGGRAPGHRAGDARRRDVVRQGHGPAVARAAGNGGAFKLTIAKWLTPDKRWIHHVGLDPGRRGRPSRTARRPTTDPVLDKAVEVLGGRRGRRRGWRIAALTHGLLRSQSGSGTVPENERR